MVVQWLRLHVPNAGGPGSIPGWGTRSLRPQLKILHAATKRPHMLQLKIPLGTSLVVQQLRLHAPKAGDLSFIPNERTRSHMLQLRPNIAK